MAVLGGVRGCYDLHFLNGVFGRRALLALLVARGIAKGGTVEEVLGRHGLAAIDAGVELAAAEHRVAIRLHRQVSRLNLKKRFRKANVGSGDSREVLIILRVDHVRDVGGGHVQCFRACSYLHGLCDSAYRKNDVVPHSFGTRQ